MPILSTVNISSLSVLGCGLESDLATVLKFTPLLAMTKQFKVVKLSDLLPSYCYEMYCLWQWFSVNHLWTSSSTQLFVLGASYTTAWNTSWRLIQEAVPHLCGLVGNIQLLHSLQMMHLINEKHYCPQATKYFHPFLSWRQSFSWELHENSHGQPWFFFFAQYYAGLF